MEGGVFAIYSRKSKFTGKGESVENQAELCRQYIASVYGGEALEGALVYEDEGYSGGNLDRPQFREMMAGLKKNRVRAIVVYRLDRISRNIGDFANLINDLGDRGVEFISIREKFDTSSPMGRAMMYIASVFSQLERETIAERIRDNMRELAKTGRWLGGVAPLGYRSESFTRAGAGGREKRACKLARVPGETALVKEIFDTFLETNSLTLTAAHFYAKGVKTRQGKDFTRFAVRNILTNPVYMDADGAAYGYFSQKGAEIFAPREAFDGEHGVMAYNRTLQRPGKANVELPAEEWIVSVGGHRGLISGAQWVRVQNMLSENSRKSYRKPRSGTALLSGLLICGECGGCMRPKRTSRRDGRGEPVYTYMCVTREMSRGERCHMRGVNGNALDAAVLGAVRGVACGDGGLAALLAGAERSLRPASEAAAGRLSELQRQEKERRAELSRTVEALTRAEGTAAERYLLERIDALHRELEALNAGIEGLAAPGERELADGEAEAAAAMLSSFPATVDACGVEDRRALLKAAARCVVWDGERARIYLTGSADAPAVPPREDSK